MRAYRHTAIHLSPPRDCDHDAAATGRLVIEGATVRAEITCARCGRTLEVLAREPYTPKALIHVAA